MYVQHQGFSHCIHTCSVLVVIGLWLDPAAPSGSGNFLRHIALFHSGALVFLLGDVFLLLGAGMLTGMQAMQV